MTDTNLLGTILGSILDKMGASIQADDEKKQWQEYTRQCVENATAYFQVQKPAIMSGFEAFKTSANASPTSTPATGGGMKAKGKKKSASKKGASSKGKSKSKGRR